LRLVTVVGPQYSLTYPPARFVCLKMLLLWSYDSGIKPFTRHRDEAQQSGCDKCPVSSPLNMIAIHALHILKLAMFFKLAPCKHRLQTPPLPPSNYNSAPLHHALLARLAFLPLIRVCETSRAMRHHAYELVVIAQWQSISQDEVRRGNRCKLVLQLQNIVPQCLLNG
jgi:hypothetical protein